MKLYGTLAALAIAAVDIAAAILIENRIVEVIVICLLTIGMVHLLMYIMKFPIRKMQDELKATQEENQQLEMVRREFVANVTHELKTPLTSISGFIETLQAGAQEDPEIRTKFLDIIAIETDRLKRLIEDVLVLSDIESRREEDENLIRLSEIAGSTAEFLEPIATEKGITLDVDVDETLMIKGNADRVRQMLFNLTENAIKYSNEGGRVWITGQRENGKIVLAVKDEGIGISPENIPRLFERFYRVDKSRASTAGGTGLGLSIVKHIAALLRAELKVESEVGKGSTFKVIIPDDVWKEEDE